MHLPTSEGTLVGYSARVEPSTIQLSEAQRSCLIRRTVKAALSVDDMVWPDLFSAKSTLQRPQWVGYVQDLWASLLDLTTALDARGLSSSEDYWLIAIKVFPAEYRDQWQKRIEAFDPPRAPVAARSIGFDVADSFLLSALCNGAPSHESYPSEVPEDLVAGLNEVHLFTSREYAERFVPIANARLPEHAPFFTYEVLRL
jgi:hypothetical protein